MVLLRRLPHHPLHPLDRPSRQHLAQKPRRMPLADPHHILRGPLRDNTPPAVAAFRPHVDHPVGGLHHFEVVLDHHDRIALVDQLVQHLHQLGDVVEMQAGGRLVEDVEGAAGGALAELLRELDALRFAARERRRLLADLDVVEADALQRLHLLADRGHGLEQRLGLLDRHVEHIGDRLVAVFHLQRLAVVALALADVAGDVDVRQEMHLDLDQAVALAGLAAAALDVEGEAAGLVAACLGLGQA